MNTSRLIFALLGAIAFAIYLPFFLVAEAFRFLFAPRSFRRDLDQANAASRSRR